MSVRMMMQGRKPAAGGGGFSPDDIANLEQWIRADSLSLSNGDPVSTWADDSGNGRDFTQATSDNRPTFQTGIVNGLPVVRGDGVNDKMTSSLQMSNTDNFTLFFVGSNRSLVGGSPSANDEAPYQVGTGGNGYALALATNTNKKGFLRGGQAWHSSSVDYEVGFEVWVLRRSAGTWKLYVNGGAPILTVAGSAPSTPTSTGVLLGHGSGAECDHDVVEAGCYSVALSDSEVDDLGGYLADRIGTTWTAIT